jgi:hypothetical protein
MQYLVFFERRGRWTGRVQEWIRDGRLCRSKQEAKREVAFLANNHNVRNVSMVVATGGWKED